jgi:hypothetical protein
MVRVAMDTLYGRNPLKGVEYNRERLISLLFIG